MGCDIHTKAEVFYSGYSYELSSGTVVVPGSWRAVKAPMWDNTYYASERPITQWNTPCTEEPYTGRNYTLFSWLAGVRNSYDSITPLAEPRGVPEDASKQWRKYNKKWGSNLHSQSYFTLTELIESEKQAKSYVFKETGVISLSQYLDLKENGTLPEVWCGWTSMPTLRSEVYEALSSDNKSKLPRNQQIEATWDRPLWDSIGWFYEHTVDRMKVLVGNGVSTDEVRLVFGFDN